MTTPIAPVPGPPAERVAENLNRALIELLGNDPHAYLLGEDVVDPYGGAFRVTRGLSTRFPDRVYSTPISEAGLVGVANGLALSGEHAIAEIMFADFATLAFDQIVNFAAKAVSMFGRPVPMHLLVRCPTGGRRGYGPTHSQSPQKHFLGVPHLWLYEVSPFVDNTVLLPGLLGRGEPAILFEDKVLYTQRMLLDGTVDDLFRSELLDRERTCARVFVDDGCDWSIIAPGGAAHRAIEAARELFVRHELTCQVVVPSRLYPIDPTVLDAVARADRLCIVDDGVAGGTWGGELARVVYETLWGRLARPVLLLTARDSVIPAAAHLEREVFVQAATIVRAIEEAND